MDFPLFRDGDSLGILKLAINIHSDHLLRRLRKPEESIFRVPQGGFFRYVSCANYFGEIVEWCGWARAQSAHPLPYLDPEHLFCGAPAARRPGLGFLDAGARPVISF